MKRRNRVAIVLSVVVATLAAASVSISAPALAAPPTVVSATNPSSISLTSPGQVLVQSITITKGTWSLFAKASVINAGTAGDFYRCELVDATHSTVLDGSTAFVNPSIPRDVITNVAVLTVKRRVTISQECGHDGTAGDSGFVDGESTLVGFVTAPAGVASIVRTKEQVPLGTSGATPVANLSLSAGDWIVVAKLAPVVLSAPSVEISCTNESVKGGAQRELGTATGLHAVSTIFVAGALKVPRRVRTVHLVCSATGAGAYIDPGAVLFGWKVASPVQRAASSTCPVSGVAAAATDALVLTQTGQCDLAPGTRSTPLAHTRLTAGTWVALGGVFDLASEGVNTGRCELYEPKQSFLLDSSGASDSTITGFPITGLANLAVVKAARARTVDADCGEDNGGADGVSSVASWVFLRP